MSRRTYIETEAQKKQREQNFTYHAPKIEPEGQPQRYNEIRDKAGEFSAFLNENCPHSRELSLAMTNLEQAVMWANAAIARNE